MSAVARPPARGSALSSEEQRPNELVDLARRAEEAGFAFAMISDHFHPWTSRQGQSPFVWSVLGGVAPRRMPGRFMRGVAPGEALNEHVTGARWPRPAERREMLEEAVGIIRRLW